MVVPRTAKIPGNVVQRHPHFRYSRLMSRAVDTSSCTLLVVAGRFSLPKLPWSSGCRLVKSRLSLGGTGKLRSRVWGYNNPCLYDVLEREDNADTSSRIGDSDRCMMTQSCDGNLSMIAISCFTIGFPLDSIRCDYIRKET